jgi:tripartite ATP-independent transporter DctP family solute receptor
MEASMVPSRRSVIAGLASGLTIGPRYARSQTFEARQYHPQPVGSHLHIYLTKLWDAVRAETGGQLDVTVHAQNNGAIIADPDILKLLQSGELEFFVLNGNILSQAAPSADIQGIPFAFTNSEQVTSLTDGKLGDLMRRELVAAVYLIPFGCMENGFKQITSVSKAIRTAADLEGFRMRTPGGKLFVEFYEALGAEPRIVGFNRLYQALVEGQVDGQENPLVIAEENRLYEVCKYLSMTSHQWAGYNMIVNNEFWQRLPAQIQGIVIRNANTYVAQQRAFVRAANANLEETLRHRGMVANTVDIGSFRDRLSSANFYRNWRQSIGQEAWALMEAKVGTVG